MVNLRWKDQSSSGRICHVYSKTRIHDIFQMKKTIFIQIKRISHTKTTPHYKLKFENRIMSKTRIARQSRKSTFIVIDINRFRDRFPQKFTKGTHLAIYTYKIHNMIRNGGGCVAI